MLPCLLGHVYQSPDFIQGSSCRYFYCDILTVLHRVQGDRDVVYPVGADIYQVDVIPFAQLLVNLGVPGITRRLRELPVGQRLLGCFNILRQDIAKGDDLHSWNIRVSFHGRGAPHTEPYESDPYGVDGRHGESDDVLLSGRTGRNLHLDWLGILGCRAGGCGQDCYNQQ